MTIMTKTFISRRKVRAALLANESTFAAANIGFDILTPATLAWVTLAQQYEPRAAKSLLCSLLPTEIADLADDLTFKNIFEGLPPVKQSFTVQRFPQEFIAKAYDVDNLQDADGLMLMLACQHIGASPMSLHFFPELIGLTAHLYKLANPMIRRAGSLGVFHPHEVPQHRFDSSILGLASSPPSFDIHEIHAEWLTEDACREGMLACPEHLLPVWDEILSEMHATDWSSSTSVSYSLLSRVAHAHGVSVQLLQSIRASLPQETTFRLDDIAKSIV